VSPDATFTSQKKVFPVPNSKGEKFEVNNYEDSYAGVASLRSATARSDNSVYAELGLRVGTKRIAALAREMGVRTPISTNPAMTLGGLKEGVTPLELAYAYSTIANKGVRVSGSLDTTGKGAGPVAIERVEGGGREDRNKPIRKRVFPAGVGETAQQLLLGVVQGGTGKAAQIGEFAAGKTGTTENYGDAWFVGFNKELTVAVWVGYPDALRYMRTEYGGQPVAGGTYPAGIWQSFMTSWIGIRDRRDAEDGVDEDDENEEQDAPLPAAPSSPVVPPDEKQEPPGDGNDFEVPEQPQREAPAPRTPAQPREPAPAPQQPAPQQPAAPAPPAGGGGGATPPPAAAAPG
jgi:penicillin-binding protein 1A